MTPGASRRPDPAARVRALLEDLADALDRDDSGRVLALLSRDVVYRFRDVVYEGPEHVARSYADAARWGREHLDSLVYESEVESAHAGGGTVLFTDRMRHAGSDHVHRCRQHVVVGTDGLVASIEHEDLPGEREAVADWFAKVGLER
ncbi:MAG: hypothetical protein R3F34_00385 [Planctomycetota bacterium]